MRRLRHRLDLQAKIILVLVVVIIPTFLIVTITQNKLTLPLLKEEMRQMGVTSGKTLAAEIVSSRLLRLAHPTLAIEGRIQEILYSQPSLLRMDVIVKDHITGALKNIASNVEEDPIGGGAVFPLVDTVTVEFKADEFGMDFWEIRVPIEQRGPDPKAPRRIFGNVHVITSLKLVERLMNTVWKITATAATFSVVTLLFALSYFLRKTIANDRRLRQAESQNLQLTEQLHDAQRQLMNTEKLAVMGQLTASFAHEMGTPLNAIGGHLQLLKEELASFSSQLPLAHERLEVIQGQLTKIEEIVKGFLQSTAKQPSQRQLVDFNRLIEWTLGVLKPRIEADRIEVKRHFNWQMGPVRVVPLDLEQICLNLLSNSLDSLQTKISQYAPRGRCFIEIDTRSITDQSRSWAQLMIYDTGEGIKRADLKNVMKPFYTTKPPGEGTGLGLTICQQLVHKHGGLLKVDSKEGAWTRVTLRIPYHERGFGF